MNAWGQVERNHAKSRWLPYTLCSSIGCVRNLRKKESLSTAFTWRSGQRLRMEQLLCQCHGVGRHHHWLPRFRLLHIIWWRQSTAPFYLISTLILTLWKCLVRKLSSLLKVFFSLLSLFSFLFFSHWWLMRVFFHCWFAFWQMLKHVHLSPYRSSMMSHHGVGVGGGGSAGGRSDTLSLNSTMSCSSLSNQDPLSSRSSSYTSLNESSHHLHQQHPPSPMVSLLLLPLLLSYHLFCLV